MFPIIMTHINFFDLTGIRPINSDANGDFLQKLELELPHPLNIWV